MSNDSVTTVAAAIAIELMGVSEDAKNAVELAAGALAVKDRKLKKFNIDYAVF